MDTNHFAALCSLSNFVTNSVGTITIGWRMTSTEVSVLSSILASVEATQLALCEELPHSPAADQLGSAINCAGTIHTLSLGCRKGDKAKRAPRLLRMLALSANQALEQLSIYDIHLDDEHVSDSLAKLSGLRSLSLIAFDSMSCSIRSLSPGIRSLHALESLSIHEIKLSDEGAEMLAAALKDLPILSELRISSAHINAKRVRPIAAVIALGRLRKLFLKCNDLDDNGVTVMVDTILSSHRRCSGLESLDLGENSIGPEGGKKIAELVSRSPHLRALCVSYSAIGGTSAAAEAICKALRVWRSLEELDVDACELGPDGVASLLDALREFPALNALRMGKNSAGDSGARKIAQFLLVSHGGRTMNKLLMWCNHITEVGALELARALVGAYTLRSIHMTDNEIGHRGARAMIDALAIASIVPMDELDFSGCEIGNDGAEAVGRLITRRGCRRLILSGNQIRSSGAKSIANSISESACVIDKMDLTGNPLGDRGAIYLLDKLIQLRRRIVCTLCIINIGIGVEGAMAVKRAVKSRCVKYKLHVGVFNAMFAEAEIVLVEVERREHHFNHNQTAIVVHR